MKQSYRILYYLIGFLVGSGIVYYIWAAKNTTFDYGPNARVLKDLRLKERIIKPEVLSMMSTTAIDTSIITYLLKEGEVDFSKSDTRTTGCKVYYIEGTPKKDVIAIRIKNCDSTATVMDVMVEERN
ncbi:DUF4258 domain-containing protein [Aquimarina sp. ERC-38]|uniref:DUF4258 domain-containing protein n=1 Tax=Aquimarina sp. ERC-38 TaxID=2949996 RepID=UPI002247FBFC|nr:DUF4258 domain-containing protein [Aquimarina sp. ERC-38]UZO79497.1 DUF4258 domain-containing protein [Aquimarina sp. ERC-38]